MRTTAELASTPGHPAIKAGAAHKKRFEPWLTDALRHENVTSPATVARQIVILLDGAASRMLVHRDAASVEAAGDIATSWLSGTELIRRPQGPSVSASQDQARHVSGSPR